MFKIMRPIILYVHHVGSSGGSTNSLINMISGTSTAAERVLIVPKGSAATRLENLFDRVVYVPGIPQFDNTKFGFYRGFRWIILLREIYLFVLSIPIFLKFLFFNSHRIVAVHYNEITLIPLALISKMFSMHHVFHVRSLQAVNRRQSLIFRFFSDAIFLPIDEYVNDTIPKSSKSFLCRNTFIRNQIKIKPDIIKKPKDSKFEFVILGGEPHQKGIDIALQAIEKIRKTYFFDLKVTIFGMPELNSWKVKVRQIISSDYNLCINIIKQHRHSPWVSFENFSHDQEYIFKNKDILLFTTRLNAPGRPIIEGCHYHVPSIYCTDQQVSGVFNDVAISCSNSVESVTLTINSMLEKLADGFSKNAFNQVVEMHSSKLQASILEKSYGVKICERF